MLISLERSFHKETKDPNYEALLERINTDIILMYDV